MQACTRRLFFAHEDWFGVTVATRRLAEGLREFWDPIKKYWATPENREQIYYMATPAENTRWQYENGVSDKTLLDPNTWTLDQFLLDRPGNGEIQADLMLDCGTNLALYPKFQAFFRKYQPPTLIVWGKNDFVFPPEGSDSVQP